MQNINFEEKCEEFMINGDKDRVLRFNPNDAYFLAKVEDAKKQISDLKNINIPNEYEEKVKYIEDLTLRIKDIINTLFYDGAYDIIFKNQSPLTMIDGELLFSRFFKGFSDALKPYIEKQKADSIKKMNDYKETYDRTIAEITNN